MTSLYDAAKYHHAAEKVQSAMRQLKATRLIRQWFRIIDRAKQQVHLRNKAAKTRSKLAFVKLSLSEVPAGGETSAEEAARMFQLSSTLLHTLVHMQDDGDVKLTVGSAAEGEALDIKKQGNADHYTLHAVRDRKRLSYNVRLRAVTHMFWLLAVQDDREAQAVDYEACVVACITASLVHRCCIAAAGAASLLRRCCVAPSLRRYYVHARAACRGCCFVGIVSVRSALLESVSP